MFNRVNGCFEEINGNKYLTNNESKDKIKKHEKMWNKIRDLIRSVTKKWDHYDEKYVKIKFSSDDKSPLNKTIKIPIMVLVVNAIFYGNNKYCLQVFLDEYLYEI